MCTVFILDHSSPVNKNLTEVLSDEYNPYCSKWGYCTWTPSFGNEGPPQSRGAVEDGVRGQCRDDKDCTPWAPSCSPLGYCRGGVQVDHCNLCYTVY